MSASDGNDQMNPIAKGIGRISEYFSQIADADARRAKFYLHGVATGVIATFMFQACARQNAPLAVTTGLALIALHAIPVITTKHDHKNTPH
jgi:hypothetical protein